MGSRRLVERAFSEWVVGGEEEGGGRTCQNRWSLRIGQGGQCEPRPALSSTAPSIIQPGGADLELDMHRATWPLAPRKTNGDKDLE